MSNPWLFKFPPYFTPENPSPPLNVTTTTIIIKIIIIITTIVIILIIIIITTTIICYEGEHKIR